MHPILFRVGDAALFAYPFLFSLAYFVGLGVWLYQTRPLGISAEKCVNLSLGALLSGLVGARLLHIIANFSEYLANPSRWPSFWEGGIVFAGGLVAAIAYLSWAMPRNGISRQMGFDSAAPAIAASHALGRIGCFMNGCCYGKICPYPWGVRFNDPISSARPLQTPLHPTQLYEAFGLVLLALLLSRHHRRGGRIATSHLYLAGYGILRFTVEFFRGDPARGFWGPLSTSQWLSLAFIITAVSLDLRARRDHKLGHES